MATAVDVDLRIDLQTMDETGLQWTFLDEAPDPRESSLVGTSWPAPERRSQSRWWSTSPTKPSSTCIR